MNLEDVIDPEYGLQQDEWSFSKPVFGDEGQLEVVGWSGRSGSNNKFYIVKCAKCCQDGELFGEGYFKILKGLLIRCGLPCGCSKNPKWTKDQFHTLCFRKAEEIGYVFIGFVGEWRGQNTKIQMICEKHGIWSSGTINNLSKSVGCPRCKVDSLTKPDSEMIASFFASGAFHPDTKFWRSERKNARKAKVYWLVECVLCMQISESRGDNLQLGQVPCACSVNCQQEGYINLVLDGNTGIAIKFGIAISTKRRVKQQNSSSVYEIRNHLTYSFPDVASCKKAERECKQELECGIILKRDMPDGYTETTWVYNLDKVKVIYERNGGILIS